VSKFVQSVISQRFLEVLDELLDKRIVESVATFCARTEYAPQSMSQIRAGKRDVTLELISKMFSEFGGNPIYIVGGTGEKILSAETMSMVQEPRTDYTNGSGDKQLIETLERLLKSKEDNLADLRATVARMEKYITLLEMQQKGT
jgi:hypothetical protein